MTVGVNYLHHLGSGSDEERWKSTRRASSLQQLCGQNIARDVRWFTQNECVSPQRDWGPRLKVMRLDFDGGEMRSPEPLTWRQVAPALPKAGHGARIVASEISEGWMRDVFDDPLYSLLPRFGMAQMRWGGKKCGSRTKQSGSKSSVEWQQRNWLISFDLATGSSGVAPPWESAVSAFPKRTKRSPRRAPRAENDLQCHSFKRVLPITSG